MTLEIDFTLPDGNCALNAFGLGLMQILNIEDKKKIEEKKIERQLQSAFAPLMSDLEKALGFDPSDSNTMATSERWLRAKETLLTAWKNEDANLQRVLAEILRGLIISKILDDDETNDEAYKKRCLPPLLASYNLFKDNNGAASQDDIFIKYQFIKDAFTLYKNSEKDLITWWNEEGYGEFLIALSEPKNWLGDMELQYLAKHFGVNLVIHKDGFEKPLYIESVSCGKIKLSELIKHDSDKSLEALTAKVNKLVNDGIATYEVGRNVINLLPASEDVINKKVNGEYVYDVETRVLWFSRYEHVPLITLHHGPGHWSHMREETDSVKCDASSSDESEVFECDSSDENDEFFTPPTSENENDSGSEYNSDEEDEHIVDEEGFLHLDPPSVDEEVDDKEVDPLPLPEIDPVKVDPVKIDPVKKVEAKGPETKPAPVKLTPMKAEKVKIEPPAKAELVKPESAKPEKVVTSNLVKTDTPPAKIEKPIVVDDKKKDAPVKDPKPISFKSTNKKSKSKSVTWKSAVDKAKAKSEKNAASPAPITSTELEENQVFYFHHADNTLFKVPESKQIRLDRMLAEELQKEYDEEDRQIRLARSKK